MAKLPVSVKDTGHTPESECATLYCCLFDACMVPPGTVDPVGGAGPLPCSSVHVLSFITCEHQEHDMQQGDHSHMLKDKACTDDNGRAMPLPPGPRFPEEPYQVV